MTKILYCLEVKIPIAVLGAEIDRYSPPEQLKEFGEILSAKSQVMSPQPKDWRLSDGGYVV